VVVRGYLWFVTVAITSGIAAGVLAAGAGGRLVCGFSRSPRDPTPRARTEADEIVGRITANGALAFIVFTALSIGVGSAVIYLLVRRWLPAGRAGRGRRPHPSRGGLSFV
jgi:hypothetical protein